MVVPIRKQMGDLDKKISDMEKSISLIAKHVKSELDEAKRAKPRAETGDVQELRQHKEKIAALEAAVRTITKHVKDELEATKKEVKEAQLKLMLDVKKAQPQQDDEKIAEVERRLNEEIERVESFVADSNKVLAEDMEKKFTQELARLEDLVHDSGALLTEKGMEEYISKISKLKQNLERYVNVKAQLLETRINEIMEMVKGIEASRDFLQMDEKVTRLETKMTAELGEVRGRIGGIESFEKDVGEIKQSLQALAPESELVGMQNAIKSLRKKLDVFETAEDFQKFRHQTETRLAGEDAIIAETRDKLEENMKKVSLDFTYRINQMKRILDEEVQQFKNLVNEQELQEIRNELEDIRHAIDNENVARLSLEKNFDDLEQAIKGLNVKEEVEAIRRSIENETANRLSLEKSLADMEKNVAEMKEKYSGVTKLEHLDFEKVEQEIAAFRESVKSTEREMNMKAMNIITEQLNEFARAMDRRVPDLMTKDEFLRSLTEIKAKMQGIQAPDLMPMALRVEQLEREVGNIANMMNSMYNRLPIVVE